MNVKKLMYNKTMKKGFTIIEVAIFLAISGAVFASVMGIFSANVARHRYQDSLNDIIETVKNTYASTINVENARIKQEESSYFCSISSAFKGDSLSINSRETDINDNYPGRTRCAIYGQLITFGEQNQSIIHRYDIIGTANTDNINPDGNDDVLSALRSVGANIATITQTNSSAKTSCIA